MIVGFNTNSVDHIPQVQVEGRRTAVERHSLKFGFHLVELVEATLEPNYRGAAASLGSP
jgi:hypothetical protein